MTTELWIKSDPRVLTSVQSCICPPICLNISRNTKPFADKHLGLVCIAQQWTYSDLRTYTSAPKLHAVIQWHADTANLSTHHHWNTHTCAWTLHQTSCLHCRLFSSQLYGSVVWLAPHPVSSLLPAQRVLPQGRQSISMLRDAWNSGYATPPSSPTAYKTEKAPELLSFCGDLYNLQQPLCTLLMPLAVPRTDPAPSQGQSALIMHCELARTGWTVKLNNLQLSQWSDALKWSNLRKHEHLISSSHTAHKQMVKHSSVQPSPFHPGIWFITMKANTVEAQCMKHSPFPNLPAIPLPLLPEPNKSM